MAMRAAVGASLSLPSRDSLSVRTEGPVTVHTRVALAADLISAIEVDGSTGKCGQLVAVFCIVTVKTPEATITVIQDTRVRRKQLASLGIGRHVRMALGAGVMTEGLAPRHQVKIRDRKSVV